MSKSNLTSPSICHFFSLLKEHFQRQTDKKRSSSHWTISQMPINGRGWARSKSGDRNSSWISRDPRHLRHPAACQAHTDRKLEAGARAGSRTLALQEGTCWHHEHLPWAAVPRWHAQPTHSVASSLCSPLAGEGRFQTCPSLAYTGSAQSC